MSVLAIGAVFLASSLAVAAQTTPTPTPDAGTPAPQHHAKTRKPSGKKGARKKARNKKKTAAR